jgi:hypothetical protein
MLAGVFSIQPAHAQNCQAKSGDAPPAVVELFTSEGCSSCPPADKWLSSIEGGRNVVAMAFHVDYWNQLGWRDRFATPANTSRQYAIKAASGSSYVYTPQVVLNGRDWRNWRGQSPTRLPGIAARQAPALQLRREGGRVFADIAASALAGELAGYWAVLEDGHVSRVRAGENAGSTLKHDHVVTFYQPVEVWNAQAGQQLSMQLPASDVAQRVAFVVTDRRWAVPVQALVLSCQS